MEVVRRIEVRMVLAIEVRMEVVRFVTVVVLVLVTLAHRVGLRFYRNFFLLSTVVLFLLILHFFYVTFYVLVPRVDAYYTIVDTYWPFSHRPHTHSHIVFANYHIVYSFERTYFASFLVAPGLM